MQKRKIRVLVVEDSRLYQMYLRRVIEQDQHLEIAGIAGTGKEAKRMAQELQPDVITLDLHLEDISEFELLKYLLRRVEIPIIVVSSLPQACEEALRLGAHDFIQKIEDNERISREHFAALLQTKIKMQASNARQKRLKGGQPAVPGSSKRQGEPENQTNGGLLIAIGASVGGTESTLQLLQELPPDMPPILVVQHMPVGFTKPYAMRLNQNCALSVAEARDGNRLLRGQVLVAESGRQMKVVRRQDGYYIRSFRGGKVAGFCPSVDVLFDSVAESGSTGIGVLLTGMGRDGVSGIKKMHEKGFYTMGQEEESCVVFGMPREAYLAGALDELLTPQQIAARIIEKCRTAVRG